MPRAMPIIYAGIPSHSNAAVIKVPKLHKHNHQVILFQIQNTVNNTCILDLANRLSIWVRLNFEGINDGFVEWLN